MRVSSQAYFLDLQANLSRATQNLRRLSKQLSSGKRLTRPSDDPLAVGEIIKARADLMKVVGRQAVLQRGMRLTGVADVALDNMCSALRRAQDLALSATQPGLTEGARSAMAEEIRSIRARIVDQANASVQGDFVFAGRNARERPFSEVGGVISYNGTSEGIELWVAPQRPMEVTVPGDRLFNFEDVGGDRAVPDVDADLFALLEELATHIEDGDDAQIEARTPDLQRLYEHVVQQRGVLGARTVRLQQAHSAAQDAELHAEEILADVEAVDIVEAFVEMGNLEVSYQAALAATAKMAQMPTRFELTW